MGDQVLLRLRDESFVCSIQSNLIMGCSSLAGLYAPLGDDVAEATVRAAIESGFLQFDTAPHYGCGLAEKRLGTAIHHVCSIEKISELKLWSKVGRLMIEENKLDAFLSAAPGRSVDHDNVPGSINCIFPDSIRGVVPVLDYTGDGISHSHFDSLKRTGLKMLYGLRIHDCESPHAIGTVLAPISCGGGLVELIKMRADGLIHDVSIGLNDAGAALAILRGAPEEALDSIMIAGSWNLLDHSELCMELLKECQMRNIVVHNAGIFASGLLVGGLTYSYSGASETQINRVRLWKVLCDQFGLPLPAVAIKFALLPSIIGATAIGFKSPAEVLQTVEWSKLKVPHSLFVEAKRRGLIASHVPLMDDFI